MGNKIFVQTLNQIYFQIQVQFIDYIYAIYLEREIFILLEL